MNCSSPFSTAVKALLALPLFILAGTAAAAVTNVQSAAQDPALANTLSVTFAAAQTAGDLNVVVVGWNDSTSSVTSVTDTKGNTYVKAVGPTIIAGSGTQVIYYAQNIAAATAGANAVTVLFNTTVSYPDVRVLEYSGLSTTAAFDAGVGASGTSTSLSSGSVATTNATDVLIGASYIGGGYAAAGSGYTTRIISSPDGDLVEDRLTTATGSYSATSTQSPSSWWVMQMAAFRVASTADTTPPTAPTNLAASATSSAQVSLVWSASTDNVGVTGYIVQRCQGAGCSNFAQIGTPTTSAYNDSGLMAATSYSYRVQATDAAGNLSAFSGTATVITNSTSTGGGSPPPVASVQTASSDPASALTATVTYASAQSAGDLNVVVIGWNNSTAAVNAVSDSKGNSYVRAVGPSTVAGAATQVIYYAQNIAAAAAGANTVSVTFNATVPYPDVRILEYSGVSTTAAFDTGTGATGTGTSLSSGSVATSTANELLVGASYIGGGYAAAGSGYTTRVITSPDGDLVEDRVVTSGGSYSATSTQSPSSWWVMQLAAFRASGSGGGSASSSSSSSGSSSGASSSSGSSSSSSGASSSSGSSSSSSGSSSSGSSSSSSGSSSGTGPTSIAPRRAALTLLQTQQFTTNAAGGAIVNWSVDGVAGGNSTVGTVSSNGLYTPPATAGTHTVSAKNAGNAALSVSAPVAVTDLSGVTTYRYDAARTGQNLHEYALTPATVSSGSFGKRWSCALDGTVYAQPLYVSNLTIGGGVHNVLFVATMHDSLYAFDADNPGCVTYWHSSYINPSAGITSTSSASAGCNDILSEYGITGTPVIDPSTQTIFFVTNTTESGNVIQRLHAVNIQTGAERPNSPTAISAKVNGVGDGGNTVSFSPLYMNQRAGLVLADGGVIIAWSSHCDQHNWHGWMMRYDENTLTQTAVFNATPNKSFGGIWMSGAAPALDTEGNMFFSTGNGGFDNTSNAVPALSPNNDLGESFLNLNPSTLALQDFYTPSQNAAWTKSDYDISAGGITVLPDGVGPTAHPDVLVGTDKQSHIWMIDRTNMSGFQPNADDTVQYLRLTSGCNGWCMFSSPGYWNGTIFVATDYGPLIALQLQNGLIPASGGTAVAASRSNETYAYPSPSPMISASPSSTAIVWVLDNNRNGTGDGSTGLGPAVLRAYAGNYLGTTLYSSSNSGADTAGNAAKFTLPVVANGHVYVAGAGTLTVYGLAP